jgi:hypothetical protein
MAINIRNPDAKNLTRESAWATRASKTEALTKGLSGRLARIRREPTQRGLADRPEEIAALCARLPVPDDRRIVAILRRAGLRDSEWMIP